jgi:hypothetical protein
MKVYRHGEKEQNLTLHVQPGIKIDASEFKDMDGKPILISVQFKDGVADVPDNLGRFLIDNHLAAKSQQRILVP